MKAIRYLAYAALGVVVLVAVALGAAVAIVDGKFVMGKAERWLKDEKQRTLKVEGEPKLSLFPVFRLALGKTTLSEPKSEQVFVSLDAMEVAVKVIPLLSREVAVDTLSLSGFRANVVRRADGSMNFDDLAGKKAGEAEDTGAPPRIRIAEVKIDKAAISYADQASGQTLTVGDLNLRTGRLEDDTPTPLSLAANVTGKRPDVALKTQLEASAKMNLARQVFAFSKLDAKVSGNAATLRGLDLHLSGDVAADLRRHEYAVDTLGLQVKGTLDRDALAAALSAPKLRITSSKAEGQAVSGTFSVKGPQRTVNAKLNMAAVEGSASALSVPALSLDFDGTIAGNVLKGQVSTPIKANLKDGVWELAKVAANLTLGRADTALKAQLSGAATVNPAKQMFAVKGLDATASGTYEQLRGLDMHVSGNLAADARKQDYTADKVTLQAKGTYEKDAFTAAFQAPKLRVTPSKAEGQAVTGAVTVKGPQRDVDAKLNIAAVEGSASALSIPSLSLDLVSMVAGNGVKGNVTTPVRANLAARTWDLPKVVANLTFSGPAIPQKTVTLPITGAFRADLAKQTGSADFATRFDETSLEAKLGATRFEPLVATFDVNVDKLNVDRYLPPEGKGSKADEPIDLGALRGKTVTGKFAAGALTVKRVKLQNVKADIRLANGKLDVAPHSAGLYGGTLAGSVSADANGNRFAVKETIQNVNVGNLLRDAAQKDMLEGRGNITMDVQTVGTTVPALKKALAGSARVEMKDGAVKGINLAESFRNAKAALGSKSAKSDAKKQTDFSAMTASFAIKNGVARNDDLNVAAPFARLGGAGNLDIGNNLIDYLAKATLVATSKGQGGAEKGQVAGVTVPVKLTGALDNPDWSIDYAALLMGGAGAIGAIGGKAGEAVGGALGKAGGALGGVLGRKPAGDAKSAPPAGQPAQKPASPTDKIRGLFGR